MSRFKDLTGQKFGRLTAKEVYGRHKNGHIIWLCECECGGMHRVTRNNLVSGDVTSCGCKKDATGNESKIWKGCGEISGSVWGDIKHCSKRRNIPVEINIQYAWKLFLAQNKKCALTGRVLVFAETKKSRGNRTASLDRIDSTKGYVEGNVQWIHKDIQQMKWTFDQDHFIQPCKEIAQHHDQKASNPLQAIEHGQGAAVANLDEDQQRRDGGNLRGTRPGRRQATANLNESQSGEESRQSKRHDGKSPSRKRSRLQVAEAA